MIVPGSNLLGLALTLIAPQGVEWSRATGRTENDLGQWVTTYDAPVALWGSWQPLAAAKYTELGLDLAKRYFVFYVSASVASIERAQSPDVLVRDGRRHVVEDSDSDWLTIDGWRGVLCVDVGPAV